MLCMPKIDDTFLRDAFKFLILSYKIILLLKEISAFQNYTIYIPTTVSKTRLIFFISSIILLLKLASKSADLIIHCLMCS